MNPDISIAGLGPIEVIHLCHNFEFIRNVKEVFRGSCV